jgi:hypothetical protein
MIGLFSVTLLTLTLSISSLPRTKLALQMALEDVSGSNGVVSPPITLIGGNVVANIICGNQRVFPATNAVSYVSFDNTGTLKDLLGNTWYTDNSELLPIKTSSQGPCGRRPLWGVRAWGDLLLPGPVLDFLEATSWQISWVIHIHNIDDVVSLITNEEYDVAGYSLMAAGDGNLHLSVSHGAGEESVNTPITTGEHVISLWWRYPNMYAFKIDAGATTSLTTYSEYQPSEWVDAEMWTYYQSVLYGFVAYKDNYPTEESINVLHESILRRLRK